ncbi:MAG: PTS N-acetylgalactosamine transporter subunit IIB [Erysipelotrichaceae bacterium]
MPEPNIVLVRIDNRLIHGLVATIWCVVSNANLLLVANDDVATDQFRQGLMNMCAPSYAQTRFFTIEKTCDIIHKASPKQSIAIICETPQDVLRLVEGGVPITKVNIGNMHMADGKRQVATSVAVDDSDVAAFAKLRDLGVQLEIKRVPDAAAEDINELFK